MSMNPPNWAWYTTLLVMGAVVAAVAGYIVGIWFPGHETFLRTMGGVLQFFGVGSVAWGISEVRRSFGLPSTTAEFMAYWLGLARVSAQRIWRAVRRPKPHRVIGTGTTGWESLSASSKGRGRVRSGPNASIEERIAHLERLIDSAEDRLDRAEDDLQREIQQRVQAIASERQAREADTKEIRQRLETFALGGVRLQTIGLLWLLVGIGLSNWSKEISDVLGSYP
jgi:hypothetical protein